MFEGAVLVAGLCAACRSALRVARRFRHSRL